MTTRIIVKTTVHVSGPRGINWYLTDGELADVGDNQLMYRTAAVDMAETVAGRVALAMQSRFEDPA